METGPFKEWKVRTIESLARTMQDQELAWYPTNGQASDQVGEEPAPQSFRDNIMSMCDQYDQVSDSIAVRVQEVLANVINKKGRCEQKIARLRQTESSGEESPGNALDASVLEMESSRIKSYEKQIEDLEKQFAANQEINAKLLETISSQLRHAITVQDIYNEFKSLHEAVEIQKEPEEPVSEPQVTFEHRLTERADKTDAEEPANFDWPTTSDLVKLTQTDKEQAEHLQIIGVENNRPQCKFNFVLSNGWRSSLQARVRMFENVIPVGSVIKSVMVYYGEKGGYGHGLYGLQFFDKAGTCLLTAGDVKDESNRREIVIGDDERIVGVVSRLNKGFPAFHQDVQFKVVKLA